MKQVEKAAIILNRGGLIIFPTETVFGIGCLLTEEKAVEKLYFLKGREVGKPTLALVENLEEAKNWVEFTQEALVLAKAFWPGPLTICLPVVKKVPQPVLGPANTLGVRVSSHPFLLDLLPKLKAPLLAPSANRKGESPAVKFSEIDKSLASNVNYVVDVEPEGNLPSTIVTFANQKYNVVREGQIKASQIQQVLKKQE